MNTDFSRALACASEYRRRGLSPLPSRMDRKGPMVESYATHYDRAPIPESVYESWATTNLQIITGNAHPGISSVVVVDLDGDEAAAKWEAICRKNEYRVETPWVARTGSGGTHIYYSLPRGAGACESGMLWGLWDTWGDEGKGRWEKHKEIRLLADRALVVAPPSIHVDTGHRYQFSARWSPSRIAYPETAPGWLLAMPRLSSPRTEPPRPRAPRIEPVAHSGRFYRREAVLAAIPDKVALARSWGLEFGRVTPNESGWVSCFAIGRDDRRPSGSFHAEDGIYQDRADMACVSLFDLGSLLQPGSFPRWQDCRDWCGDRFLGR